MYLYFKKLRLHNWFIADEVTIPRKVAYIAADNGKKTVIGIFILTCLNMSIHSYKMDAGNLPS